MQRPARSSLVIVATAATGLIVTAALSAARLWPSLGDSRYHFGILTVDDLHEGQLELAAAMVLALIAAVMWGRVRRMPTRRHLLLFTALCMLALDSVISGLLTAGLDSLSASRFATWTSTINGLIAVLLLTSAAWIPDEPLHTPRRALGRTLLAVSSFVVAATVVVWLLRDLLPGAFTARPETPSEVSFLSDHPSLHLIESVVAISWAVAALLFAQLAVRSQDELTWWLALAAALSTVSSINYALFPSKFTELLYLGDYFFLLAVCALLIGSVREVGAAEAALVDRALYEERRRIAREMHDGVAQELAIMSTQAHHLRAHPETVETGLRRIQESVDRAMDESRTAITHLSGPVVKSQASEIGAAAEIITGREGARLELDLDDSLEEPATVRLALVHVTQDAVSAAVRGRGASTVHIDLHRGDATVLRISDDASGPPLPGPNVALSMTSIRERVSRLGGATSVRHSDGGGTTVEVTLP